VFGYFVASLVFLFAMNQEVREPPSVDESLSSVEVFPSALLLSVLLIVVGFLRQRPEHLVRGTLRVRLWERFGALLIDLCTLTLIILPWLSLLMVLIEWAWSGEFSGFYAREFTRGTDWLPAAISLVATYFYFVALPRSGLSTVGQYVMGYRIVPIDDETSAPRYFGRVALFCVLIWGALFVFYYVSKREGDAYWWEKKTNTLAVRTSYSDA
tara:strand:+ start:193 stop:828 length:636 start_codon:yes stop_codon:yes gene_type:complete